MRQVASPCSWRTVIRRRLPGLNRLLPIPCAKSTTPVAPGGTHKPAPRQSVPLTPIAWTGKTAGFMAPASSKESMVRSRARCRGLAPDKNHRLEDTERADLAARHRLVAARAREAPDWD